MTHWVVFSLRGWIAFVAFMNLGTAARCFLDNQSVHAKFFPVVVVETTASHPDPRSKSQSGEGIIERLFGFWSITNGFILLHCAVFIQDRKIMGIAACALALYLCFFATEIFVYKTFVLNGATLYPFAMTGLSLLWLTISFNLVQNTDGFEDFDENAYLRKKFPFKEIINKKSR